MKPSNVTLEKMTTNTVNRMNGSHAYVMVPSECFCFPRRNVMSTMIVIDELKISTNGAPIVLSTANCTIAKVPPHTSVAGNVSLIPLNPSIRKTNRNGSIKDMNGMMYVVRDATSNASRPVKVAGVVTGIPIAPYDPPAILATRQRPAACTGLNPNPVRITAVIATGAPNPAAPSKNAPKQYATSRTWIRRSGVIEIIDSLMISPT